MEVRVLSVTVSEMRSNVITTRYKLDREGCQHTTRKLMCKGVSLAPVGWAIAVSLSSLICRAAGASAGPEAACCPRHTCRHTGHCGVWVTFTPTTTTTHCVNIKSTIRQIQVSDFAEANRVQCRGVTVNSGPGCRDHVNAPPPPPPVLSTCTH